jgi:hypothetical protein
VPYRVVGQVEPSIGELAEYLTGVVETTPFDIGNG